ncbi:MAG: hypothetical protein JOZ41_06810 [Chloroflexi bacterium]|nr:hypothetical protein [Chloroflexota bacterium]
MDENGGAPPDGASDRLDTQRAEEMVDRMGQTVGGFAAKVGLEIMKAGARAREEVEDMWAEAQSLRHGDQA